MSTQTKERQVMAAATAGTTDLEQVRPLSPTEREWKQRIYERLLKVLDLSVLGSLGEDRTQLAISARYRPPLGVVGRTVDRVLLHRVAEATVKDFLDRVGERIQAREPAST